MGIVAALSFGADFQLALAGFPGDRHDLFAVVISLSGHVLSYGVG